MPAKTTSFKSWADSLWQQAQTDRFTKEVDYWTSQPWAGGARPLPVDHVATETTFASLSHVRVSLGVEETQALLTEVSEACRTQINEVLLTALARAFAVWTGGSELLVDIEGHGREEEVVSGARLSRTVGWFTTIYPALIELSAGEDIVPALQRVKKRLRAIPVRGIGYGMLRYLSRVAGVRARMSKIPKAQVSFNYLGQFDQTVAADGLVSGAAESTGPAQNDKEKLHYLISVNGMIADRKLTISWLYSDQVYEAATIERLANSYLKALREIIAHSEAGSQGSYDSSDFPLANLEQKKLDHLSALIDKMSEKSGTNSVG
jgi:non-ribosomal peptide synthase protein (TIGR01720 family)